MRSVGAVGGDSAGRGRGLDHASLNYLLKRVVRRERPLERGGRPPLIVAPASPSFRRAMQPWRRQGDRALGLCTGRLAAVRYPGRPDGCLARLPRGAPRLRRGRRAGRRRLCGRGLRAAGRLMASLEVGIVGCRTPARPRSSTRSPNRTRRSRAMPPCRPRRTWASPRCPTNASPRSRAPYPHEIRCPPPCSSPTSRGSCAAVARATAAWAASTSVTCVRRTRWRTSCASSTTRPSRTRTGESIPSWTPRPSTSSCCSRIRSSLRGAPSAPSALLGSARRARATSSPCWSA